MPITSVPSINLQYFFCIVASLFGTACAKDRVSLPDVSGIGAAISNATSSVATAAGQVAQGGFWSWLWPFGSVSFGGGAGTVDTGVTATGASFGFWVTVFNFFPEPVQHAAVALGIGLSFLWSAFSWLSFSVSGIIFMTILSSLAGLIYIRLKEWNAYNTLPPRDASKSYGWSRWQDLLNEAMTADPKRWKLSIVAADGMLGELLTRLGYHGETTGDQMRAVPEDAFVTVPAAWEAHRVKNFVAARNSNYILTQREAFRVMKLYEQVFEEFDFI